LCATIKSRQRQYDKMCKIDAQVVKTFKQFKHFQLMSRSDSVANTSIVLNDEINDDFECLPYENSIVDVSFVKRGIEVVLCRQCGIEMIKGVNCSRTQFCKGHKCLSCVISPSESIHNFDIHVMQSNRNEQESDQLLSIGVEVCDDKTVVDREIEILLCKQCGVELVKGFNCSKNQFRKGHKCLSCVISSSKMQRVIFDAHIMELDWFKGKKSDRLLVIKFEADECDSKLILGMGVTYMSSCCNRIIVQHYIVSEATRNSKDLYHLSEFAFGVTSFATLDVIKSILGGFIEADYTLVSRDSKIEMKILSDFGFEEFLIIDLNLLYDKCGKTVKSFNDYCYEYFHAGNLNNAGNNTYATFQATFGLLKRLPSLVDTVFNWDQYLHFNCQMCVKTCGEKYFLKAGCVNPKIRQGFYVQVNRENFKRHIIAFDDHRVSF